MIDMCEVIYRGRRVEFGQCDVYDAALQIDLERSRFHEMDFLRYIEAVGVSGAYVDAGAGVGMHTLFFALYCNADRVYSFELRSDTVEILENNVNRNAVADRVKVFSHGLSDRCENVPIGDSDGRVTGLCQPLDETVDYPISLMRIDVGGMEHKVLLGAKRILTEYRPLVFAAASTSAARASIEAFLAEFGYRPTGRLFNTTPTYEFAYSGQVTRDSEVTTRGESRVREVGPMVSRSLLHRRYWHIPDVPAIGLTWTDDQLVGEAKVRGRGKVNISNDDKGFDQPPVDEAFIVDPRAPYFLQINGEKDDAVNIAAFVVQYNMDGRTVSQRCGFHPRLFVPVKLAADTARIRIALRVTGVGAFHIDAVTLHHPPRAKPAVFKQATGITFRDSREYWEARYRRGGTSGEGSYGHLAEFKSEILNAFVKEHDVHGVIEFGCGDGHQLSFADYPAYLGLDVSQTAIALCMQQYADDRSKSFLWYDSQHAQNFGNFLRADLTLSLDVIFHLLEDEVYYQHLRDLFEASDKYVTVYASNRADIADPNPHVRHREFTPDVERMFPQFEMFRRVPNKYVQGTLSDFFFYRRKGTT